MKSIREDIWNNAQRVGRNEIWAEVLINLFVNYEVGSGKKGLKLIDFLVSQGVDANITRHSGDEHWIVIMNPNAIVDYKKVPAKEVDLDIYNLANNY